MHDLPEVEINDVELNIAGILAAVFTLVICFI